MKNYKTWTPEQRSYNLQLFNRAKRLGLLKAASECRFCGQTKGILHTHCSDYDVSLALLPKLLAGTITPQEYEALDQALTPVCWRCHMMIHKKEKHPLSADRYFKEIQLGIKYPPVYRGDAWYELDQHMID